MCGHHLASPKIISNHLNSKRSAHSAGPSLASRSERGQSSLGQIKKNKNIKKGRETKKQKNDSKTKRRKTGLWEMVPTTWEDPVRALQLRIPWNPGFGFPASKHCFLSFLYPPPPNLGNWAKPTKPGKTEDIARFRPFSVRNGRFSARELFRL